MPITRRVYYPLKNVPYILNNPQLEALRVKTESLKFFRSHNAPQAEIIAVAMAR